MERVGAAEASPLALELPEELPPAPRPSGPALAEGASEAPALPEGEAQEEALLLTLAPLEVAEALPAAAGREALAEAL